jgi:hypothetical protein
MTNARTHMVQQILLLTATEVFLQFPIPLLTVYVAECNALVREVVGFPLRDYMILNRACIALIT